MSVDRRRVLQAALGASALGRSRCRAMDRPVVETPSWCPRAYQSSPVPTISADRRVSTQRWCRPCGARQPALRQPALRSRCASRCRGLRSAASAKAAADALIGGARSASQSSPARCRMSGRPWRRRSPGDGRGVPRGNPPLALPRSRRAPMRLIRGPADVRRLRSLVLCRTGAGAQRSAAWPAVDDRAADGVLRRRVPDGSCSGATALMSPSATATRAAARWPTSTMPAQPIRATACAAQASRGAARIPVSRRGFDHSRRAAAIISRWRRITECGFDVALEIHAARWRSSIAGFIAVTPPVGDRVRAFGGGRTDARSGDRRPAPPVAARVSVRRRLRTADHLHDLWRYPAVHRRRDRAGARCAPPSHT